MDVKELKSLLQKRDPAFWTVLAVQSRMAGDFSELFLLSALRRKAIAAGLRPEPKGPPVRIAILGGYSLYPLNELIEHLFQSEGMNAEWFNGDFDNYVSETMEPSSPLYRFRPEVVLLLPSERRCVYPGKLSDPSEQQRTAASDCAGQLLDLARTINERSGAEIILANLMLPPRHDPGSFRSRLPGTDWNFRKLVNLELGLRAPACVHICDKEFLAYRCGGLQAADDRGWFESKQPGSPALQLLLAREVVQLVRSLRQAPKKVAVLDLDNTLWGGIIAEEGMEGIEIGDTSSRGEAFKAFQKYLRSLIDRGVLLAVCSKNDHDKAMEPFEKHPEMVLRPAHFVSFKANWEPKSENIRRIAAELNLGLDSFVFVDDNPAEIEIVRQFIPEVETILLGPDPSCYVGQLQDSRFFEPRRLTVEDAQRTEQYRSEAGRQALLASVTDMDAYLRSLAMEAAISEFTELDVPRLSQLINKSNQFNLTTRRRSEAEVRALMGDASAIGFSVRLSDRFGDHGLIGIVIARIAGTELEIDTWLMSCRVLKRQVEEVMLNELIRLARDRGCVRIKGVYLPTAKNEMVRDFYPRMGFALTAETETRREFEMDVLRFSPAETRIKIIRRAYESG